ncbi:MAG: sensor histidine kinase [Polyangiaceae bacterium]
MLVDFIMANRAEIIARTRARVAKRAAPRPTEQEIESGVPLFLNQLADMLRRPTSEPPPATDRSAAKRGASLSGRGYTVAQVVFDYGDICQSVTELAHETEEPITADEFQTLNQCLDNAIAEAVTEYTRLRDQAAAAGETERSGVFAHELRNKLSAASLSYQCLKDGRAPMGGSVSALLGRSLQGMTALLDRALVEVRLDAGNALRRRVPVHQLLEDAEVDGTMQAGIRGVSLSVAPMDRGVDVDVDPHILAGAVANLLQNAIKFTHVGGHVALRANVVGNRIEIEVEDQCGGLPPGKMEELFDAFKQRGSDRTGLGLGLFISRKGVQASGGVLRARDVPGRGCVFTIDLPTMRLTS